GRTIRRHFAESPSDGWKCQFVVDPNGPTPLCCYPRDNERHDRASEFFLHEFAAPNDGGRLLRIIRYAANRGFSDENFRCMVREILNDATMAHFPEPPADTTEDRKE